MLTRILATCLLATLAVVASAQEDPFIYILGVVQDAGYPQAGCYRPHCMPGWEDARLARGATSIAVVDPRASRKYLFEATPDLPRQLYDLNQVAPDSSYQLAGVFLTHAHIGHFRTGLMHFGREVMGHHWRECLRHAPDARVSVDQRTMEPAGGTEQHSAAPAAEFPD